MVKEGPDGSGGVGGPQVWLLRSLPSENHAVLSQVDHRRGSSRNPIWMIQRPGNILAYPLLDSNIPEMVKGEPDASGGVGGPVVWLLCSLPSANHVVPSQVDHNRDSSRNSMWMTQRPGIILAYPLLDSKILEMVEGGPDGSGLVGG